MNPKNIILGFLRKTRTREVWEFDNGVKVYKDQLIELQIERYKNINLHEPEEEKIFCRILNGYRGDGVFVDIGAAAGYYCFLARKLNSDIEIHAFNPSRRFVEMMKKNMKLNNIYDIRIHREAISRAVGRCDIKDGWGGSITNGNSVNRTTIDNFYRKLGKNIYLIKMDIQGEELNALKGVSESFSHIKNVIIGTHSGLIHKECLGILGSKGYDIPFESEKVGNQPDGIIVARAK